MQLCMSECVCVCMYDDEYTQLVVFVWNCSEVVAMIRHGDFVQADNVSRLCAVRTDNWPWQLTGQGECKMLSRNEGPE